MWVFYESAISVCQTARQVAAELNDPQVWGWLRDESRSSSPTITRCTFPPSR
jgi:hypothetical protein